MKKINFVVFLFLFLIFASIDQVRSQSVREGYNPLSATRQVHEDYLMWKRTIWRNVNLKEPQNKPFFAKNREITKFIFDAVANGTLQPYTNDSVTERQLMTAEEFAAKLVVEEEGAGEDDGFADDGFGDDGFDDFGFGEEEDDPFGDPFGGGEEEEEEGGIIIPPQEISLMELKEDIYFDRVHSRIYFDIQAVTLILPAASADRSSDGGFTSYDYNPAGFEKAIASFRFIDLYNLFKDNPDAIWYNDRNIAQHKNLSDAFLLRLFKGNIVKVANVDDNRIADLFDGKEAIIQSLKVEQDLIEWEASLWEY